MTDKKPMKACDHKVLLEHAEIPTTYAPEFCPKCADKPMTKKPMTVEEIAEDIVPKIVGWTLTELNIDIIRERIEKALLSFSAKEAEPLVEQLQDLCIFRSYEVENEGTKKETGRWVDCGNCRVCNVLTAHRAKYPRKA